MAEDGIASYNMTTQNFYIRKKRPEDEIDVSKLPSKPRISSWIKEDPERKRSKQYWYQITMAPVPFASTEAEKQEK